ncbi:MAG: glycosyltransferase [Fermentimonas sp.]|nr:glycosyltransferase [Dysgonamonadaceae bacterium]MDD4697746.1 glycosyltransferase [Fermentimonas sp.]
MINNPISISILTINRIKLFKKLVYSLKSAIEKYPGNSEVIICDASSENIRYLVLDITNENHWKYIRFNGTEAHGRNIAMKNALNNYVLFTDDDCEVSSDLLVKYNSKINSLKSQEKEFGAIYGVTEFKGTKSTWFNSIYATGCMYAFQSAKHNKSLEWGTTSNALFTKMAWTSINGFIENDISPVGGVDVSYGIKLTKKGYKNYTEPEAIVFHTTESWNNKKDLFNRMQNYGRSEYNLCVIFPERVYYDNRNIAFILFLISLIILIAVSVLTESFFLILLTICIITSILVYFSIKWKSIILELKKKSSYFRQAFIHKKYGLLYKRFIYRKFY